MAATFDRSPRIYQRYTILEQCSNDLPPNRQPQSAPTTRREQFPSVHTSASSDSRCSSTENDGHQFDYADFLRSISHRKSPSTQSTTGIVSGSSKRIPAKTTMGLADVLKFKKKNEAQHDQTMRVIEEHMWQHKQEERELKRIEGDVLKQQLQLKRAMDSYSADMERKKRNLEKDANENIFEMERKKKEFAKNDKKSTEQRLNRNIGLENRQRDKGRKSTVLLNGLEFQYQKTAKSLCLKRLDIDNLTKEYEMKLKKKEDEEFELKKKLAELSISLNMESQKHRKQNSDLQRDRVATASQDVQERNKKEQELKEELRCSMELAIQKERNKMETEQQLNQKVGEIAAVLREENRRLTDVRNRIQVNIENQKNLREATNETELERQNNLTEEKVLMVTAKRNDNIRSFVQSKQQQNVESLTTWQKNNLRKTNEMDKKKKEDDIRHLQRYVKKQKDTEIDLFSRAKSSESKRMKIEQTVSKLQNKFDEVKEKNSKFLTDAAAKCHREEEKLRLKIMKEEAELAKAFHNREHCIQNLVKVRTGLSADKEVLETEMKVYDRLSRIGIRSEVSERELAS